MKCASASKTRQLGRHRSAAPGTRDDGAGAAGAATAPRGSRRPRRSCPRRCAARGRVAGSHRASPSRMTSAPAGRACSPKPPPLPWRAVGLECRCRRHHRPRRSRPGRRSRRRVSIGSPNTRCTLTTSRARSTNSGRNGFWLRGFEVAHAGSEVEALPLAWYWSLHSFGGGSARARAGAEHPGDLGGQVGGRPAAVVACRGVVDLERADVLDDAAAHLEALPADPARGRRREVADHLRRRGRDRCGRTPSSCTSARPRSIRHPMVASRVAPDGMIAVHRDAVRSHLGGDRLGERERARLRRGVVRLPGAAVDQEARWPC